MSEPDPSASTSLSEHEQAYHEPAVPDPAPAPEPVAAPAADPDRTAGPEPAPDDTPADPSGGHDGDRDEHGRWLPKGRAKSQQATPADVELINQYTKRLRAAEDALGVTITKQPGESERVYQLRRRAELAELRRDAKPQPQPAAPAPRPTQPAAPTTFTEPEPRYEDFADAPDQYAAHLRAVTAWDRRKDAFEQQQQFAQTEQHRQIEQRNAQRDAYFQQQEARHAERMQAYHQAHPQAQAILDAAGEVNLTPALYLAILTADNGPQLLLRLAQDDALRDDLTDVTDGRPLTRDLVERVQRRLSRGLTDAPTGSSPALTPVSVPRPPNPVRTGPMKPADSPPGDDAPLSAHEAAYGFRRRR